MHPLAAANPLRLLILLALVLPAPAPAHNGAVAVAVPVAGITVDGELDDWPPDMVRYWLGPQGGNALDGWTDLSGAFRVGYNPVENALYVALEIADDSVVWQAPGQTVHWRAQDVSEIYLEATHTADAILYVGQHPRRFWLPTIPRDPSGSRLGREQHPLRMAPGPHPGRRGPTATGPDLGL